MISARERAKRWIAWREAEPQTVGVGINREGVIVIRDLLALLSAPEPAETAAREPDAMCHATHWRRHLDEWGDELTVRSYDPEKCSGEGPPWPVWIGVAPHLGLATTQVTAPEREAPTPEKLRAWAEWFDDPKNPMVVEVEIRSSVTAGFMLRRVADALALATPEAEGGST